MNNFKSLKLNLSELKQGIEKNINSDTNFEKFGAWFFISELSKFADKMKRENRTKIDTMLNSTTNKNYRVTKDDMNLFAFFATSNRTIYNTTKEIDDKIKAIKDEFKDTKIIETPKVELTIK